MYKENTDFTFTYDNMEDYKKGMQEFKTKHECTITYRSTIKPIHFPVKVTLEKKINKYVCHHDY